MKYTFEGKVSEIPPDLIAAYMSTEFRATDLDITMRIGVRCPKLDALFREYKVQAAGFLTAFNPYSKMQSHSENLTAQVRLVARVSEMGLSFLNGVGIDPTGPWEGEDSILILGCKTEVAVRLGREFEQNAVVHIDANRIPQLILLR